MLIIIYSEVLIICKRWKGKKKRSWSYKMELVMKTSIHSWKIRTCKVSLNTANHLLQVMALGEKSKWMLKKLSMEQDTNNFEDSFKKFITIRMHIWNWCRGSINLALLLIQEQLFQLFKRINYHLSPVSRTTKEEIKIAWI